LGNATLLVLCSCPRSQGKYSYNYVTVSANGDVIDESVRPFTSVIVVFTVVKMFGRSVRDNNLSIRVDAFKC